MTRRLRLAVLLGSIGMLGLIASGCSSGSDEPSDADPTATAMAEMDEEGELADAEVAQSLKIEMRDFEFAPATISAKAGDVIEIAFTNDGSVTHDFTIEHGDLDWMMMGDMEMVAGHSGDEHAAGMAMHVPLEGQHEAMTRMRVHEPGVYVYYCTVPGHRELGMEGTLTVQ